MPFTTNEIVKKHILDHHIGSAIVSNETAEFSVSDSTQLQNQMILASSETIKAKEQNVPVRETISFAMGDEVQLGHPKLIPDSIIVASDSSLGIVYVENIDYHIDYSLGTIRRLTVSAIPANSDVVIWYQFYRVYQRGVDYDIDYQAGTIRRRSAGAIEAGQWVLIDYTTEYGSLDDSTIDNAITEANEQVNSFIDESYRESSDRGLVMAETYMAVSIICRIKAMESLSPAAGQNLWQ